MMIKKFKPLSLLASLLLVTININQSTNASGSSGQVYSEPVSKPIITESIRSEFNTSLSEAEFNTLFLESLANDENGQLLLSVSDSLSAELHSSHVEFSAVINLDKVEQISPEARASVEKFDSFFLFLDKNRLNVKVIGEPVTRNGLVGIKDNFSIELGPIPLSNGTLRQLGLDVAQANTTNLQLNNLYVHAMKLLEGHVDLATSSVTNN